MNENPPDWCRDYIRKKWQAPYGCFWLVAEVLAKEFGIKDIPDYTESFKSLTTSQARAIEIQDVLSSRSCRTYPPDFGSVVVVAVAGKARHLGIVVAQNWMLHCSDGINTTLVRLNDPGYRNRIKGYYNIV